MARWRAPRIGADRAVLVGERRQSATIAAPARNRRAPVSQEAVSGLSAAIAVDRERCRRSPLSPLDVTVHLPSDERAADAGARRACTRLLLDDYECLALTYDTRALLDSARTLSALELQGQLGEERLGLAAEETLVSLRQDIGLGPCASSGRTRLELLADQLQAHSWQRFLNHTFLGASGAAARYADPLAALDAVASWAQCEPAACVFSEYMRFDGQRRVVLGATLLRHLARAGSLYLSERDAGLGKHVIVPASVSRPVLVLFIARFNADWRYADRARSLVRNPYPHWPGSTDIRFDGVCFRGATRLSMKNDAATLDRALPYYPGEDCRTRIGASAVIDQLHPVGTLSHTLRTVLNLLSEKRLEGPMIGEESLPGMLATLSRIAVAWRNPPGAREVHPGWLAALHLAYSNGLEPLSMPQLRAFWDEQLYAQVTRLLDAYRADPDAQSPWLAHRLSLLPPPRRSPSDYALVRWMRLLRDDLKRELALFDAGDERSELVDAAEIDCLRRWRLDVLDTLQFYRTPSEHFDMVCLYAHQRLQALLPGDHNWSFEEIEAEAAKYGATPNDLYGWLLPDDPDEDREASDESTPTSSTRTGSGDKPAQFAAASTYFLNAVRAHQRLVARAAESVREEGKRLTRGRVLNRARTLKAADPPSAVTHHVVTPGMLLGFLPLVGDVSVLLDDVSHRRVINSIIDAATMFLPVADMYAGQIDEVLSHEVTATFAGDTAPLLNREEREVVAAGVPGHVRVVRTGAVYRTINPVTREVIDDGRLVTHEVNADAYVSVLVRELHPSIQTLASNRFTVSAIQKLLHGVEHFSDPLAQDCPSFARFFRFAKRAPALLQEKVRRTFDHARRRSPTFRLLLARAGLAPREWTIHIGPRMQCRTIFAEDNALGADRIHLGVEKDVEQLSYMGVSGFVQMTYERAVLHELVHALTRLPDTTFEMPYGEQEAAVRGLAMDLQALRSTLGPSPIQERRRRSLEQELHAAREALNVGRTGMAEQRGPIVYFVDRILQESEETFGTNEERVMYLAGPNSDALRREIMAVRREEALSRLHEENALLDRAWVERLTVSSQSLLANGERVGDRPAVIAFKQFIDRLGRPPESKPSDAWLDAPATAPRFDMRPELETGVRDMLKDVTQTSATFQRLLHEWSADWRKNPVLTFSGSGKDGVPDVLNRRIDVAARHHIVTAFGTHRISPLRAVVSGIVTLMLNDLRFPPSATGLDRGRSLAVVLEQRILDENGAMEPMRVNAALYIEAAIPAGIDKTISRLTRTALMENKVIEALRKEMR